MIRQPTLLIKRLHLLYEFAEAFKTSAQEIFRYSENNKPEECRFYVRLSSTISDAVKSDRARLAVESVFYKDEKRR
jgi:hypothetical protein